jgi:hypothetical protein
VEILSMSIDSMFVHKMWDDHELSKMVDGGVPFPMLSDAGGKVGKLFGVYNEGAGVENRGRFIIDPGWCGPGLRGVDAAGGSQRPGNPAAGAGLSTGAGRPRGRRPRPSGWRPGKLTLKPGPDLVGKVWEVWKTKMAFD